MDAYQDAIGNTAAEHAPWYVVPADKKWFARLVVAGAIYEALAKLKLRYPEIGPEKRKELTAARAELMDETKSVARSRKRPVAKRRVVAKRRSVAKRRPAPAETAVPAEPQVAHTGASASDES
jgi:Polyphosphate kinase 2 (PPK2)